MQADLQSIIETTKSKTIQEELAHDTIEQVYIGSDFSALSEEFTNILLVTNLVHSKILELAEEFDIVAVIYTNGHKPRPKDIERAKELDIDLMTSPSSIEEVTRCIRAEFGTTLDIKVKSV